MYEMYPDDWAVTSRPSPSSEQPRRRARKSHSVRPSILMPDEPELRGPDGLSRVRFEEGV